MILPSPSGMKRMRMGEEGRRDGTTKDASGVRTVGDSSYFHGIGGEWRSEAEAYEPAARVTPGSTVVHCIAQQCTRCSVQCAMRGSSPSGEGILQRLRGGACASGLCRGFGGLRYGCLTIRVIDNTSIHPALQVRTDKQRMVQERSRAPGRRGCSTCHRTASRST